MRPALQPWRNIALEAGGLIPDSARHRVSRVRRRVETITTDSELDERIQRATEMFVTSDDEARRYLGSFEMQRPIAPNDDPFSARYISAEWDLYRRISQRDQYEVSNESMDLDIESALVMPYPYSTGSPVQVADQLGACSFIIRSLGLERSMQVVEFGPGWANLTLQFAMMGIDTTAVEVEPRFAELLRGRGSGNTHLDVVVCDMLDFEPPHQYDAAIFYESFHHCSDHLRMLRLLHSIVKDTGVVVFATVISLLTKTTVTDTANPVRAFNAELPRELILDEPQYQASELLIGAIMHGCRFEERPVTFRTRRKGETKKSGNFLYGLRYGRVVMRTFVRERKRQTHAG